MPNNTIGWGQAAANNSNGFGAAAQNNNINWGWIHSRSYGHDETNLVGAEPPEPSFFDKFGTPAAAYSLRDLSGSNPNVIEVRRSSDNAVQDFTASEITDGSLATWVGVGNDGFIRTWYDQTGANDATQTTSSRQPLIVNAGLVILENGLPAIDFDGVDDRLVTNAFSTSLVQPNTTFVVNSAPNNTNDNTLIDGLSGGKRHLLIADANRYTLNAGIFASSGINSDAQSLIYTLWNGALTKFATNGGSESLINVGVESLGGLTIGTNFGSSNANDGTIQEIVLYNEDKTTERSSVETNINDYYSIY